MRTLYSKLLEAVFVKTGGRNENIEIARVCADVIEDDPANYVLVRWPESQELMDEEWFDSECYLASNPHTYQEVGNSAYFVPANRMLSLLMKINK